MKKIILFVITLMIIGNLLGLAQTGKKESSGTSANKIEVYYFHYKVRCVTCKAVETQAKADLEALYSGKVSLKAINLDEESSKEIAEKLKISGQTLLIVKGDQQINLTNEGFLYAITNPEKLKSIIRMKVDGLGL